MAARYQRRTGREVTVDLDGPSTVEGRRAMLDRAVANLVDNALKFSPAPEAVAVSVHGSTIEVADRGPGVDAEDRDRVFDRFYRATSSRTLPGSGLGLSIVAQIATLHGGTVALDPREGGGTVARLVLPARRVGRGCSGVGRRASARLRPMRFVVYGAGAIGGVVGGRLAQSGHEVVLIARGDHHDAIRDHGLKLVTPDAEPVTLSIPVVSHPAGIDFRDDDVVLLAMKSQHTGKALSALSAAAPASVAVVCVQNGVANEPAALRLFDDVYGVCVVCPALHLEPGVVEARAVPVTGLLDVGAYPGGVGARGEKVAAAFASATFDSVPRDDIMRWKYHKLLNNLGNAVDALCGSDADTGAVVRRARAEGVAVLAAAGIDAVTSEEDTVRGVTRSSGPGPPPAPGRGRRRGRAWPAPPAPSRPTTSTARSSCSVASTGCPRR